MATAKDTPHTRRSFLKRVGATTLVLVAGGGVYRAADRGVFSTGRGAAYEPWEDLRSERADGPLALVQAAVLAANPHNSQPWLFRVGERRVDLFADTSRNLGAIDPFLREMHLGLGCALENAALTAEAVGYTPRVSLMPAQATPRTSPASTWGRAKQTPPRSFTPSPNATRPARLTTRNARCSPTRRGR